MEPDLRLIVAEYTKLPSLQHNPDLGAPTHGVWIGILYQEAIDGRIL